MTRRLLPLLITLFLSAAIASWSRAGAAGVPRWAALHPVTLGAPVVVDPVHSFGEPDIRIAPRGAKYVSGPWGTGTQRSIWDRSTDGGRTYHPLHESPISSPELCSVSGCFPHIIEYPGRRRAGRW